MGQVFGWYPETKEFISTIQRDGRNEVVRSRISSKVWEWFLSGINVRLFQELQKIKNSGKDYGAIDAVMLYRGGKKEKIVLAWNSDEGLYTVSNGNGKDINYGDLDRAMLMFTLQLESLMKERMQVIGS